MCVARRSESAHICVAFIWFNLSGTWISALLINCACAVQWRIFFFIFSLGLLQTSVVSRQSLYELKRPRKEKPFAFLGAWGVGVSCFGRLSLLPDWESRFSAGPPVGAGVLGSLELGARCGSSRSTFRPSSGLTTPIQRPSAPPHGKCVGGVPHCQIVAIRRHRNPIYLVAFEPFWNHPRNAPN